MKKSSKPKEKLYYNNPDIEDVHFMSENSVIYLQQSENVATLGPVEMPYNAFKKILNTNIFTIAEWASFLQLSERTFHRYAKENLSFNALLTERIQLLNMLIEEGIGLFGTNFKEWLHSTPYTLFGAKPIEVMFTQRGIIAVYQMLKRLQHGVVV